MAVSKSAAVLGGYLVVVYTFASPSAVYYYASPEGFAYVFYYNSFELFGYFFVVSIINIKIFMQ